MSLLNEMSQKAFDMGVPISVHLDVTYRCNERCVHCYLDHEDHGEMTTAEIKGVLDQLAEASRTAEIEFLLDALEVCRWNRRQAAASLNIEYKAFLYKLQKYGIVESKVKRRAFTA